MVKVFFLACALALAVGCETETRVLRDDWAGLRAQSEQARAERKNENKSKLLSDSDFAIHLAEFEGKKASRDAKAMRDRLADELKLDDVWVWEGESRAVVYRGRFSNPGIDAAERALRQTKMLQMGGKRAFENAELMPVGASLALGDSEMDLKKHTGSYTLQIAVYDEEFGPDFRQAAERAATELRKQGVEAFFYHGPNRSLVTVGLFGASDRDSINGVEGYGPRARALREKFPHNLVNGLTLKEKRNGVDLGEQPSFLVQVK